MIMSHTHSAVRVHLAFSLFLLGLSLLVLGPVHAGQATPAHEDVCARALADLDGINVRALRMAINDLMQTFPETYADGQAYLDVLGRFAEQRASMRQALKEGDASGVARVARLVALQRRALLANPLLDFDRLLVIKRKPLGGDARRARGDRANDKGLGKYLGIPQQSSWQLHTMKETDEWDN